MPRGPARALDRDTDAVFGMDDETGMIATLRTSLVRAENLSDSAADRACSQDRRQKTVAESVVVTAPPDPGAPVSSAIPSWCTREDSNLHAFRRRNLNPVRLPVPPLVPTAVASRRHGFLLRFLAVGKG